MQSVECCSRLTVLSTKGVRMTTCGTCKRRMEPREPHAIVDGKFLCEFCIAAMEDHDRDVRRREMEWREMERLLSETWNP